MTDAIKLEFKDGKLLFQGSDHTLLESYKKLDDAFWDKIKSVLENGIGDKFKSLAPELSTEQRATLVFDVANGYIDPATLQEGPVKEFALAADNFVQTHAKDEVAALRKFQEKTGGPRKIIQLAKAEKELLEKAIKSPGKHIEGYTRAVRKDIKNQLAKEKAAIEKFLKENTPETIEAIHVKPAAAATNDVAEAVKEAAEGNAKEEGFWARQVTRAKENLGGKAWKEAPVKTSFRAAGTAAGAFLLIDALARGSSTDERGMPVDRSGVARVLEGAAGIAAGSASILAGGR